MNWNEVILIGASAGGLKALSRLLSFLPEHYQCPILIVQHIQDGSSSYLADYLNEQTPLLVKEAEDKETIKRGMVYLAPPGYHMLVELDKTISLSVDPRVNFSRPSIDVLFESGAYVMEQHCRGIVLTGSNRDGSAGLKAIKRHGGIAIVQAPETAEYQTMPAAAIQSIKVDFIMSIEEIGHYLCGLQS